MRRTPSKTPLGSTSQTLPGAANSPGQLCATTVCAPRPIRRLSTQIILITEVHHEIPTALVAVWPNHRRVGGWRLRILRNANRASDAGPAAETSGAHRGRFWDRAKDC